MPDTSFPVSDDGVLVVQVPLGPEEEVMMTGPLGVTPDAAQVELLELGGVSQATPV
jgi:hypothetical protein